MTFEDDCMAQQNGMRSHAIRDRQKKQHRNYVSITLLVLTCSVISFLHNGSQLTGYFRRAVTLQFGALAAEHLEQLDLSRLNIVSVVHSFLAGDIEYYYIPRTYTNHGAAFDRPASAVKQRGVYLTSSSAADDDFTMHTIERLKDVGGTTLIVDVKGSYVYVQTTAALAQEHNLVRHLYDLPALAENAHEQGLYVIARYIAVKDPLFSSRFPEVQIRHPHSGVSVGSVWVDPSHPTVLEYNRQILKDIALSGVDEINLDYIRYPTEYAQWQVGLTGAEKADHVLAFVRMARDTINQYAPSVRLGISTYAIMGWDFDVNLEPLGQDYVRFAPYVDVISPMAYPQTFAEGSYYNPSKHPGSRMYYLVYRTLTGYTDYLGDEHKGKLRPWIQGYYTTVQNMRDQMRAVYDAGACGFTVWSAGNKYGQTYEAMRQEEVPERCLE